MLNHRAGLAGFCGPTKIDHLFGFEDCDKTYLTLNGGYGHLPTHPGIAHFQHFHRVYFLISLIAADMCA